MGQALIITPVRPGQAGALNRYLAELPRDVAPAGPDDRPAVPISPFTGVLPPTHFARFVVIALHDEPHLLFSSRFDGAVSDYLQALAATPEAVRIWSHCQIGGRDDTVDHPSLDRYLCDPRHQLPSQYVVSAIPVKLTVGQINAAVALREQVSRFAVRAGDLDPWALAHDFRQLPAIRRLLTGS
ncbi:MAG TPA: hypothetical protein VHX62_02035 [Solirubrobacteraceae bacterium]|nr:hypothetical protein [Solirubrobacteraceae bacterium]